MSIIEAVGKRPSTALPSSLVIAAYFYVRLIPRDFGSLAFGHFPSASQKPVFQQSHYSLLVITAFRPSHHRSGIVPA
jgi:hypothetical protein